jgi:hypothetical protein
MSKKCFAFHKHTLKRHKTGCLLNAFLKYSVCTRTILLCEILIKVWYCFNPVEKLLKRIVLVGRMNGI